MRPLQKLPDTKDKLKKYSYILNEMHFNMLARQGISKSKVFLSEPFKVALTTSFDDGGNHKLNFQLTSVAATNYKKCARLKRMWLECDVRIFTSINVTRL